jgi:hypothetical protein
MTILSSKPERRRVLIGTQLFPTGMKEQIRLPVSRVKWHLKVPVLDGSNDVLYFQNYNRRTHPKNFEATRLFGREGFDVHGPAILAHRVETWESFRILGRRSLIEADIAHLELGPHAVVPTSRRGTHHEVIAQKATDIVVLKMALA